ncbi:MAG: FtsX-like permease family protein [Propionibacteriaceae bacterium]|nr:FtsX-like permease family protein [Propionibacteriaceae bacterium]
MMLRDAINEIRLHPARFVATLLAIAISVGFMSAILVGVRTEENSAGRAGVLPLSKADVVVEVYGEDLQAVKRAIQDAAGVTAYEAVLQTASPLTHGNTTIFFSLISLPSEEFRWASLKEGAWPAAPDEITLSVDGAKKLGVSVGDQVSAGEGAMKVVGLTNDAPTLYTSTGYIDPSVMGDEQAPFQWAVKSSDAEASVAAIQQTLTDAGYNPSVKTFEDYSADQRKSLTGGFDMFRNLLLVFAGIALLVGMIIIANTFTILLTQRRRQIGLLRAVGASPRQVAGRLLAEALVLGVVGSLLGVLLGIGIAAIVGLFTGSLYWGLVLPAGELAWAVVAGVLATVLSVLGPSLKATRVAPLEALQVVPSPTEAKRLSLFRAICCVLLILPGLGLAAQGLAADENGLLWAIGGGALLSMGLLLAAPFYVPWLLKLFGVLLGFGGPTVRLAARNAARNPRRASATAVALMLAVGLVVTLQVAASTVRSTALEAIDDRYPVDLSFRTADGPINMQLAEQLRATEGVAKVVPVPSKQVKIGDAEVSVRNVNAVRSELGLSKHRDVPDDVLVIGQFAMIGHQKTVEVPGVGSMRVVTSDEVPNGAAAVSESTYAKLAGGDEVRELWVKLADRSAWGTLNQVLKVADAQDDQPEVGGGAVMAGIVTEIVNVLLLVLTGLLGVAVLIALVGVGNTLGLSVLERQRESALLRALGMQRSSLRVMLLVEAMLLAAVGIVVGIAAGAGFSWLGVVTAIGMMPSDLGVRPVFSVDLLYTGGLILVCVAAAALASVLPGRRAATATPTEALAAE